MEGIARSDLSADPAEEVARIAAARRSWLLRVHRRRLGREDLEDCYSQATLELLARSRRSPFASGAHIVNALEQKLRSRIEDRRRAIGGRSAIEAAIARAVPVDAAAARGAGELEDPAAAVERQVIARAEVRRLREVLADLTRDQQLVLASQVLVGMETGEFCARHGWSAEKYRKVAQRARARLRVLMAEYEAGERCRRLEPDLFALAAGTAEGDVLARARAHVRNCPTCARVVAERERSARRIGVLLPLPAAGAWLVAKLGGAWSGLRRAAFTLRHPFAEAGAPGGAGVVGGSVAGAGALKVGLAAVCVAGAAGGYAACAPVGLWPILAVSKAPAASHHSRNAVAAKRIAVSAWERPRTDAAAAGTAPRVTAPVRVTPPPPVRRRHVRRVSAIAQIEREFGLPRGRAARVAGTVTSTPTPPPPRVAAAASTPQTRQTQTEFGFER